MKLKRQFALRLLLNSAIIILVVFFTFVIYSGSDVQDAAAAVTEDTVTFKLEHCDCKRCLSAFSSHQMQGEAAMRSISLWN